MPHLISNLSIAAIIWMTTTFMGCGAGPTAEPELHLIPQGFIGEVVITHGVADAPPLAYENGARVYRIPANGQLRTSSPANIGIRPKDRITYSYSSAGGEQERLQLKNDVPKGQVSTVCIIGGYQVGAKFHYAVDELQHAGNYKNPAIDGSR